MDLYNKIKSIQDTWSRALAEVATIGSKWGGRQWVAVVKRLGWGWGPSQLIATAGNDQSSPLRLGSICLSYVLLCKHLMHSRWAVGSSIFLKHLTAQWLLALQVASLYLFISASPINVAWESHALVCHQLCVFCWSYTTRGWAQALTLSFTLCPWANNFSVPWFGLLYNGSIKSI